MAILSRKTLFALTLSGLMSTTAWSQEPSAAPPAADPPTGPVPDHPGVVHVSDCPPPGVGDHGSGFNGSLCRDHVPPHTGWNQPGRRTMYRSWVPYHRFFPGAWTGLEAGPQQRAPVVYMPTDTTQLGYYYQHAPTWHAYSGMLPPVPRPSDWHYIYYDHQYSPTSPADGTNYGEPTVVPEGPIPDPPGESVPDESGLDRSAGQPDLAPVIR